MMDFKTLRTKFVDIKIFIGRAQSYVSMMNSGMILFLFLAQVKAAEIITWPIENMILLIIPIGILGMAFIGWVEDKFKVHSEENKRVSDRNPRMDEIIERLKRIEKNQGVKQ